MSRSALGEEVKLVCEKVERLKELVEERLVGSEEPLQDEVAAIKGFLTAKKKGSLRWVPIEEVSKRETWSVAAIPSPPREEGSTAA